MEKEERKACFSIVMAAALWGCMGVFLRLLTGAGLPSNAGVALRGCLSALLYGVYLAIKEPKALKIDPRHWYYFFGSGVGSLMLSAMPQVPYFRGMIPAERLERLSSRAGRERA